MEDIITALDVVLYGLVWTFSHIGSLFYGFITLLPSPLPEYFIAPGAFLIDLVNDSWPAKYHRLGEGQAALISLLFYSYVLRAISTLLSSSGRNLKGAVTGK